MLSTFTSIGKNGVLLFLFAFFMAGTMALISESTLEKIRMSERRVKKKALLEIISQTRFDNDLLEDTLSIPKSAYTLLGPLSDEKIYIVREDEYIVAVIIPAIAPDGYNGNIKLIAGVNTDGNLVGVRVLAHRETPGLGDKIDVKKHPWIEDFKGKSLKKPTTNGWEVKKNGGDFDQFTGATITPRAVVKRIHNVLTFVEENKTLLFPKNQVEGPP